MTSATAEKQRRGKDGPSGKLVATVDAFVRTIACVWKWKVVSESVGSQLVGDGRDRMWRATCWERVKVEPQIGHLWSPAMALRGDAGGVARLDGAEGCRASGAASEPAWSRVGLGLGLGTEGVDQW